MGPRRTAGPRAAAALGDRWGLLASTVRTCASAYLGWTDDQQYACNALERAGYVRTSTRATTGSYRWDWIEITESGARYLGQ